MTGRGKSSRQRSPDTAALTPLTAAAHLHPQLHSYTATQLHSQVDICRFIELPRPPAATKH